MRNMVIATALAVVLAGCATAPKPPTADGSNRLLINDEETAGVLALRAEMAQDRQKLSELNAELIRLQYQLNRLERNERSMDDPRIVRVHFPFGSTKFNPTTAQKAQLRSLLKSESRRVELRGRTDGKKPTRGDETVALKRAQAAQDYLIDNGIEPSTISINYLSAGDYTADNKTKSGRSLNRRVEIEFVQ
jgi:outer membrane protein OmpA-like peptidoglycan-associated protein